MYERSARDSVGFFDEEFVVTGSITAPDQRHVPELTGHLLADGNTDETPAAEIRAGPPAVQGGTITQTTGRTRGSGDEAGADITPPESDGETRTVTIEGAIPTNHPHHEAVLEEATIRGDTLRVAVGVESTLEEDRARTMPPGIVEYTAEITVEYPEVLRSVSVDHPDSGYGSSWASDSASAGAE